MSHPRFTWITPRILEIRFDTSFELCDSTYLFSHHYEDPTFNGRVFTRLDLDDFYLKNTGDKDSWKRKWAGSNLPDHSFKKFLDGEFKDLNSFENEVLYHIRDKSAPFYVVMTSNDAIYCRDHEIAHALWYTDPEYKNECETILQAYRSQLSIAESKLKEFGYANKVLTDELHVFCGIYYEHFYKQLDVAIPGPLTKLLKEAFYRCRDKTL